MPSGYCSEVQFTAAALGFDQHPISETGSWPFAFTGFPPDEMLTISWNDGFDLVGRDAQSPAEVVVIVGMSSPDIRDVYAYLCHFDGSYRAFPLRAGGQITVRTLADGTLPLELFFASCSLPPCSISSDSTISAQLISTAPWSEAPPCAR